MSRKFSTGGKRRFLKNDGKNGGPQKIGATLELFLAQMGAPPVRTLTSLESLWPQIVGPGLADRTRPIEVIDGVLVIGCDDANWGSQIGWMDSQIKQRFAEIFEGAQIRRIQLKIGP